jgi:hypothetical protein
MKAIVVTDQAAGTAGMKLVERPEWQAARLASLSGEPGGGSRRADLHRVGGASAGRRHGGYRPAVRVLLRTGHLVPPRQGGGKTRTRLLAVILHSRDTKETTVPEKGKE